MQEHDGLLEMIESGANSSDIERFARDHRMSTARRLLQHLGDKMEHADGSTDAVGGSR